MSPKDPFRYQVVIARLISPRCRDRCPGDRLRAVTGYPCGLSRLLVVRWNGNDLIHWTANTGPTAIQDVAVNHGCRDILVPKQFLDRTYVVAIFQKMGCKRVSESVDSNRLGNPSAAAGGPAGRLDAADADVSTWVLAWR